MRPARPGEGDPEHQQRPPARKRPRREVSTPVGTAPASASQAMDMVHAGLAYLATADATAMAADTQARGLHLLEQATSIAAAARTSILAAFTAGQGYCADADYSPRAWLIIRLSRMTMR
jgi:hypothetical protein